MANPVAMVLNIPSAATAMPYIAAKVKLTKILIAIAKIGIITDWYPNARPKIIFVAAPVRQESATSCTGLNIKEIKLKPATTKKGTNQIYAFKIVPICVACKVLCYKSNN